jgi:hypothetical protein
MASTTITLKPGVARRPRSPVFVAASVLMGIIVVTGFWRTYFGPLVQLSLDQPTIIHIHATVFVGWLVLFLAQAVLAATGRIAWHLRLGRIGIGYGALLILVGLVTAVIRSAGRPPGGPGERLLFQATADMTMFAGFFIAGVAFRRKPLMHKRLMTVAATALLVAAVARIPFLPAAPLRLPASLAIWSLPIVVAVAAEFRGRRVVHPVYLLGIAVFAVRLLSVPVSDTAVWRAFAAWTTGLVR